MTQILACKGGKPVTLGFNLERVFHRAAANVMHDVWFYIQHFSDKLHVRKQCIFRIDRQFELESCGITKNIGRICFPHETHDFVTGPVKQLYTKTGLYSYFLYVDTELLAHCNIVAI